MLLNQDDQRNYIGNTPIVLFFKDKGSPFDTSSGKPSLFHSLTLLDQIKKLGNIALVFFIVQPVQDKQYRIGCFFREGLSSTAPSIPKNYVFDEASVKDFLLTKSTSGSFLGANHDSPQRTSDATKQATSLCDVQQTTPSGHYGHRQEVCHQGVHQSHQIGGLALRLLLGHCLVSILIKCS